MTDHVSNAAFSLLVRLSDLPAVGPLLKGSTARVFVASSDPELVREAVREAAAWGAMVTGRFDAANDTATITMLLPGVRVVIMVEPVGFDPSVALARLGIPRKQERDDG